MSRRQAQARAMLATFRNSTKAELAIAAVRIAALAEGAADDYEAGARRVDVEIARLREEWAAELEQN